MAKLRPSTFIQRALDKYTTDELLDAIMPMCEAPVAHKVNEPGATYRYLWSRMHRLEHEVFGCLYLDNRHRVIADEHLFRGTIDGASVYPREVVKQALAHNAAAILLYHNHPSGVAEPSAADEAITRRLKTSLATVDIRLLDHLVVGDSTYVSMAERGLIS